MHELSLIWRNSERKCFEMEICRDSLTAGRTGNVIFLSSILGPQGHVQAHKCDKKCGSEHICGNMYCCRLTGVTHICDNNCDQRIVYDSRSSLCRVSGKMFMFTDVEERAVRRKLEVDDDGCSSKRRRVHVSPFEKPICAVVSPIYSHARDFMESN